MIYKDVTFMQMHKASPDIEKIILQPDQNNLKNSRVEV